MCHRLSFTVNSAVLCILNKHKLWSYIYTVCAFIWKEIYIIWSLEGAGWHIYWWWKAEINLQSVWCQCLWMSTKSQGYEICCLCLCTAHRLSTQARLTTPSAYNHSAVDPETVSLTSDRLQGQPIFHLSFAGCLMAHESKQYHWILFFYIWQNLYNYCWHKVRWQKSELKTFKEQHQS